MKYQRCKRCVMDTSDVTIVFTREGYCNHCTMAIDTLKNKWKKDGEQQLSEKFIKMKEESKNNQYDCIIGISGGVDSSYVAYLGRKYGLRMLGVHIDAGWNSAVSEKNIQRLCKAYHIDLIIEKINLDEMMDLQRAYFLSGVPNQDAPQDHAFFCALYRYAIEHNIRYVLTGSNLSSESILASYFSYDVKDSVNLLDIHAKWGKLPLTHFPIMDKQTFYNDIPANKALSVISPLDYIDYNKNEAIEFLNEDCSFEYYGGKHLESRFSKLFQNYMLPVKFGHDKRMAHLSSLIVSGQMTRPEALEELTSPLYNSKEELAADIEFFITKIGINRSDFDAVMAQKPGTHFDYKISWNLKTGFYHPILGKYYVKLLLFFQKHPNIKKFIKRITVV